MKKLTISDLLVLGTPISVIARRIGITRIELYHFLEPAKYTRNTLSGDDLRKIAEFEGRALSTVKNEYLGRKAAA